MVFRNNQSTFLRITNRFLEVACSFLCFQETLYNYNSFDWRLWAALALSLVVRVGVEVTRTFKVQRGLSNPCKLQYHPCVSNSSSGACSHFPTTKIRFQNSLLWTNLFYEQTSKNICLTTESLFYVSLFLFCF